MGDITTRISIPGANWVMQWYTGGFGDFQLDLVGFLAILGEGSILSIAQVSSLSKLFFLPRLLPAPQALLRPNRPPGLDPTPARVCGVRHGNRKDHINHVAHVLLDQGMPKYTVRCVKVTKNKKTKDPPASNPPKMAPTDREMEDAIPPKAQDTPNKAANKKKWSWMKSVEDTTNLTPPDITAKRAGALSLVTMLGSSLSLILLILSLVFGDGMSLYATILLSGLSTLIGISNKWQLLLPTVNKNASNEDEIVVVRYPNGSYLIVICKELVARELYFAPEEVHYLIKNENHYRLISLCGTLMLMLGVIALANAKLQLQFAWAGAYIALNAAHWIAAALPKHTHWDFSCYTVEEQGIAGGPSSPMLTHALWKVILVTKKVDWLEEEDVPPKNTVWKAWVKDVANKADEFGHGTGELIDAAFDRNPKGKHTVWYGPDPNEWDPKDVWDKLKKNEVDANAAKAAQETKAPTTSPRSSDATAGARGPNET